LRYSGAAVCNDAWTAVPRTKGSRAAHQKERTPGEGKRSYGFSKDDADPYTGMTAARRLPENPLVP